MQVQTWALTLGFMLGFGAVIAKLYRVIHIFKNPSPNRTVRTSPPHSDNIFYIPYSRYVYFKGINFRGIAAFAACM